ncbi:MAG: NADH-quinone oxidoreductase subunit H [Thaumarchaeota archaeon]|nr:NADH-quinone oxidoreductase subunit H [Nitrososphaerota archaeon]MCL5318862.1 NADH-quinone oxidoreductase subunit H [Nitrososphaerota archaeon]
MVFEPSFAAIAAGIIQTLVLIAFSPLLTGVMRKVKAKSQKRVGASILQPYYDIVKLMRKDEVISDQTSWIFKSTPWINFAAVATAALFVPVMLAYSPFGLAGDILLVIGLFSLARFFTVLSGLDSASAFGGLGSSREMMLSSLIEPALFLTIFTVSLTFGATNITTLVNSAAGLQQLVTPSLLFALISMFVIVIAETGRLPFDNPATHLELTMVHEAMVLEYSGKRLALIEWAQSIKHLTLLALMINIFFPWGIATSLSATAIEEGLLIFVAKALTIGVIMAFIETRVAKWRLFRIPDLISIAIASSMVGVVFFYI